MENEPKKRGPGRPRTNVQHYRYAASFPLECWDYLLDASFRDSTPKDRVSVQQYLNRLIYADMKKHHWTPEGAATDRTKIMVDGEVDQPLDGQITTEEVEKKPKEAHFRTVKKDDDSGDPWDQMNEYQEKQAKKDSKK